MTNRTFTDQLDELTDELTHMVLRSDELLESAPPALAKMTELGKLPDVLEVACAIVERAQALAMLGEGVDEEA